MNHAAQWAAGTLAAVGFTSLAAMSGKALMTAMLALLLAAMCALKGHGGGGGGGGGSHGKTSHYEIITKPAIYDHDHLVHGSSFSSSPYSYARQLQTTDEGPYYVGSRGGPVESPPRHVSIVHAYPAVTSSTADGGQPTGHGRPVSSAEDNDDGTMAGGRPPYPLSPITYIPTDR